MKFEGPLFDIANEAARAQTLWPKEFDDQNTLNDWTAYVTMYLGRATQMKNTKDDTRLFLVKAAGIILNTILRLDAGTLKPSHYDPQPVTVADTASPLD